MAARSVTHLRIDCIADELQSTRCWCVTSGSLVDACTFDVLSAMEVAVIVIRLRAVECGQLHLSERGIGQLAL